VPKYQPVLAAAAWSGMRQSELLALRWCDVDFEAGFLRVSKQLSRSGEYVPPKTSQAMRDVVLTSRLGRLLREHRLASAFSGDDDPVFASATGRPLSHRNVQSRGFDKAAERAGINPKRKRGERKRRPDEARRPASFHDRRRRGRGAGVTAARPRRPVDHAAGVRARVREGTARGAECAPGSTPPLETRWKRAVTNDGKRAAPAL
jgi:integrase